MSNSTKPAKPVKPNPDFPLFPVFKYAYDQGLVNKPLRYGQGFNKPFAKTLRKARAENGCRMFEADELRMIVEAASQPLKAMILVGINARFGQSDLSSLPLSVMISLSIGSLTMFPQDQFFEEHRFELRILLPSRFTLY